MCAVHSTREEPPPLQCRTTSTRVFRRACSTRWIHSFSRSQEQNDVTARLRSEKLNMRCTCCLFMLTLWSAAAGCNNRMPMCIGSFSLHSKWIGLSKRYPNSSVLRRDVESDRLIGNWTLMRCCLNAGLVCSLFIYFASMAGEWTDFPWKRPW